MQAAPGDQGKKVGARSNVQVALDFSSIFSRRTCLTARSIADVAGIAETLTLIHAAAGRAGICRTGFAARRRAPEVPGITNAGARTDGSGGRVGILDAWLAALDCTFALARFDSTPFRISKH